MPDLAGTARPPCRQRERFDEMHDTCRKRPACAASHTVHALAARLSGDPTVRLRAGETHPVADDVHGLPRERAAAVRAGCDGVIHVAGPSTELLGAMPNRRELALHRVEQHALAVDASPA